MRHPAKGQNEFLGPAKVVVDRTGIFLLERRCGLGRTTFQAEMRLQKLALLGGHVPKRRKLVTADEHQSITF